MISLKCCGFQYEEDVRMALQFPVDAVGFILVPGRKRTVSTAVLPRLVNLIPPTVDAIGVCMDSTLGELEAWLTSAPLSGIQLHGDESPAFCQKIKERWPEKKLIKVFHPDENGRGPERLAKYAPFIDVVLLDSSVRGQRGGTGVRFDWQKIQDYAPYCQKEELPLWVAGGITPENVSSLLSDFPLDGIDVSSGIEVDGRKSEKLLSQLAEKVKRDGSIG
jgi:phosphoribosylanthranilate isomerase